MNLNKFKLTTALMMSMVVMFLASSASAAISAQNDLEQLFFQDKYSQKSSTINARTLNRMEIEWYYYQYFSTTQDNANLEAFYTGFSPQTFFDYSDECKDDVVELLDRAYDFHLNQTAKTGFRDTWLISTNILGNQFNEALYYCYQWQYDVKAEINERRERFVGFGDIYLSFIFNLLSNSLQIREATNTIRDSNDEEEKLEKWGQLFRIFLDFESYQNAGGLGSLEDYIRQSYKKVDLSTEESIQAKKQLQAKRGTRVKQDSNEEATGEIVDPNDYDWTFSSYVISMPFGLLIGALGALPDESFAYKCSKNSTSSRGDLLEMLTFFDLEDNPSGMEQLNEAMGYWDEMGLYCWYAFEDDINSEKLDDLTSGDELLQNILYNLGFMFNDYVYWRFYTPATVPNGDWAFFVSYLFGDFVMRFFYRDETV